jgi:hypothetical protein
MRMAVKGRRNEGKECCKQETNQMRLAYVSDTRDTIGMGEVHSEDVDVEVAVPHEGLYLGPMWPDHLDATHR